MNLKLKFFGSIVKQSKMLCKKNCKKQSKKHRKNNIKHSKQVAYEKE